jgi:uncharacterized membrane protein YraQ (UPF0718 family)
MNASTWVLLACTAILFAVALAKDRSLPLAAFGAAGRALSSVWIEIALGFLLVGLIEVLLSKETLAGWLATGGSTSAILAGWAAGLLLPGGPYVFFPLLAGLAHKGAPAGALIALATAKLLVSPVRMIAYEAPLLGWPFTLARLLPGLLVPPILGFIGQRLFDLFEKSS